MRDTEMESAKQILIPEETGAIMKIVKLAVVIAIIALTLFLTVPSLSWAGSIR